MAEIEMCRLYDYQKSRIEFSEQNNYKPTQEDKAILDILYKLAIKEKKIKNAKIPFNDWWTIYKKSRSKVLCIGLWNKLNDEDRAKAIKHTKLYVKETPDKQFRMDPAKYLRRRAFEDEIIFTNKQISQANSNWLKGDE